MAGRREGARRFAARDSPASLMVPVAFSLQPSAQAECEVVRPGRAESSAVAAVLSRAVVPISRLAAAVALLRLEAVGSVLQAEVAGPLPAAVELFLTARSLWRSDGVPWLWKVGESAVWSREPPRAPEPSVLPAFRRCPG